MICIKRHKDLLQAQIFWKLEKLQEDSWKFEGTKFVLQTLSSKSKSLNCTLGFEMAKEKVCFCYSRWKKFLKFQANITIGDKKQSKNFRSFCFSLPSQITKKVFFFILKKCGSGCQETFVLFLRVVEGIMTKKKK